MGIQGSVKPTWSERRRRASSVASKAVGGESSNEIQIFSWDVLHDEELDCNDVL